MKVLGVLMFIAGFASLLVCVSMGLGTDDVAVLLTALPFAIGAFMVKHAYGLSVISICALLAAASLIAWAGGAFIHPLL